MGSTRAIVAWWQDWRRGQVGLERGQVGLERGQAAWRPVAWRPGGVEAGSRGQG